MNQKCVDSICSLVNKSLIYRKGKEKKEERAQDRRNSKGSLNPRRNTDEKHNECCTFSTQEEVENA